MHSHCPTGGRKESHEVSQSSFPSAGGVPAAGDVYPLVPSNATVGEATANYTIQYVNGKLTITDPAAYSVVSSDGQTWHRSSGQPLSFTVKRSREDQLTYGKFTAAEVDGAALTSAQADTEQGSLILRLKPAYLDTLSLGSHTVKFVFSDGAAEASFTVRPVKGSFEDVAVESDTFTFKKVWEGDAEKSIDFTLYKLGDTVYHHGFDKKIVSKKEWRYSARFSAPAACYVIEEPVAGYITRYENVGVYAGITDRCCDGGTIINKKIPKTGDDTPLALWTGMILLGAAGVGAALAMSKRRKAHQ